MNLPHLFYIQDLDTVVWEMVYLFVLWTALMLVLRGKARQVVSVAAAVLSLFAILLLTVYRRNPGSNSSISLIPFITFERAHQQEELYRTMLMNVCLFLPLGLSLPFALPERIKHRITFTLLSALALSVMVEVAQLIFHMGLCETDDVIMNLAGALIGILSFAICDGVYKLRSKHVHRHIRR